MAISVFGAQGTEQIYQTGPESLAAEAFSIVTGPVSGYATHILSISGGDAPIALTGTVSGRVDEVLAVHDAHAVGRNRQCPELTFPETQ